MDKNTGGSPDSYSTVRRILRVFVLLIPGLISRRVITDDGALTRVCVVVFVTGKVVHGQFVKPTSAILLSLQVI
jgi:hypothetical protein